MSVTGNEGAHSVTVLGGVAQSGAYILHMQVQKSLAIQFGRFRQGKVVAMRAGAYLYVGSAMGQKGTSSLARRLARHATRRKGAPHKIRTLMLDTFARLRLGSEDLRPRRTKRLFWHVDYLLEPPEVSLMHVLALRSAVRLEQELAALVTAQAYTSTPVQGLGASDTAGGTHLFAMAPGKGRWWELVDVVREWWA